MTSAPHVSNKRKRAMLESDKDTGDVLDWLDARRQRVLQIAAEEISSAAVKDSPRVREFWRVVAPKEWTPAQLRQAARQLE